MPETSTPSPAEAPAASPAGPKPANAAPAVPAAQPRDLKAQQAALARVTQARRGQAELQARVEALKPLEEVQALIKAGKHADAFRKMAGGDLSTSYQQLTEQFLGSQDETKALEALPKSVRERLARVEQLEAQMAALSPVSERVKAIEDGQTQARATLEAHQRKAMATAVWDSAWAETKADPEADIVMGHGGAEALVQERWVHMLEKERTSPGWAKLTPAERQAKAGSLVAVAARAIQGEWTDISGRVLQARGLRDKNGRWASQQHVRSSQAPAEPTPKSTPAASVPRTGTPGSLGEPSGTDERNLSRDDLIASLKREEREGRFR